MRPSALSDAQTLSYHVLLVPGQGQAEVEVSSSPAHLELPDVAPEMIREMVGPPTGLPTGPAGPWLPLGPPTPSQIHVLQGSRWLEVPGPAWPQRAPSLCGIASGCSCWRHPGALPTHTLCVRPLSSLAWGDRCSGSPQLCHSPGWLVDD